MIVLDKLTRPNSDKAPLIFHYDDDLSIDQILYRTQNREHFDDNYARIMEERKASSLKDRKNVLYVALTRAVEGLIVIKKPEGSIFDEVNITPIKLGELNVERRAPSTQEEKNGESEAVSFTISDYGTQEISTKEEEEEKDYEAILFGTVLHYTLEVMGDFDEQSLMSALVSVKNRYGQLLGEEGLAQIEKRIKALIENESFQDLLKDAVIMKEQSLSFEGELKQIDLLLEYEDHMLVIDYKSSKKYSLKHQNQVQYYQKAIAHISGKRTKGMIVYLLDEGVELVMTAA